MYLQCNFKIFQIQTSEKYGKHIVAIRDIPKGSVILNEVPLVIGPKTHTDPESQWIPCVGCYLSLSVNNPPARCLQCGWPTCATHCPGLSNQKGHAMECPILKLRPSFAVNNLEDFYRHYALLPLRCLLLQKCDPKKWKQILEMEAHLEQRGPETEIYK